MREEEISNINSEAGIIASLIHKPELSFYSEHLLPRHFTDKDNQYVYLALCKLAQKNINDIDPYMIIEVLKQKR